MEKRQQNRIAKIRVIALAFFFCFCIYGFFYPEKWSKAPVFGPESRASESPEDGNFEKAADLQTKKNKYSEFSHSVRQHRNLSCNSCHKFPSANWKRVRKQSEAFPDITDYPKHESCLSCHRQQFFGISKPVICSICHTNPSPRNSARHAFPNPREKFDQTAKGRRAPESDFAVYFPHETHIPLLSRSENQSGDLIAASFSPARSRQDEKSCSICHQTYQPQGDSADEYATKPPAKLGDAFWLKKGTFKTSPISHAQCFTCHSQETGILPAPQTCAACHKPAQRLPKTDFDAKVAASMGSLDKITLNLWRRRDSSATFRHEFSSHADLECATCHNVAAMNTTDFSTKKVPVTSCNTCHITETSDDGGALNFEIDSRKADANFQCTKCHIAFGKMPVPDSHYKAIAAAGK
jgi:hypothetical protein